MADRYQIAQQELGTFNNATAPYYQRALRDATAQAASAGQLGSGQLRTSLGDLANQRNLQLQTAGQNFLQNALTGSIGDAYRNIGIAQQQQAQQLAAQNQTFGQGLASRYLQNATQGQLFGQGVTQAELQNALMNSAAMRAQNQLAAGTAGSPSDYQMLLSQIFGGQAAQAGGALGSMIQGNVMSSAQQASTNQLLALLQPYLTGGMGTTPPAPVPPTPAPPPAWGGVYDPSSYIHP